MKKFLYSAMALLAVSCATATTPNYTVNLPLSEDEDDMQAYMLNFDTGAKIDSTIVENGAAVFRGTIDKPVMAQFVVDGSRAGTVIVLEPGTINIDMTKRQATGTKLNDRMVSLGADLQAIASELHSLPRDSSFEAKQEALAQRYNAKIEEVTNANLDNALGVYLFLQQAYDFNLEQLEAKIAENPLLGESKRITKLRQALTNKKETSVGAKFKDFEITYEGETKRLSDYVGKGKYTLVDFWASWCGPCIRETAVIKQLYNKYADKGLEVLGVAVWDEPSKTKAAIQQHALPWKQIINAQTIPTDIYGISGIPCIILFDPEGNIVSRDKQDEDLVNDVTEAMEAYIKAQ